VLENSIDILSSKIRDYINIPRVQNKFIINKKNWNQICSSLDVLGDTTYAISSYIHSTFPNEDGLKYIYIYGLLQSLFLQQDSLKHLTCALFEINENEYKFSDELISIRDIRNDAIGHPTNRGNGKSFHYISRMTMNKNGFDLLSSFSNKEDIFKEVKIIELIDIQSNNIEKKMIDIVNNIEEREMEHRKKFKDIKMKDFLKGSDYSIEKLFESLYTESYSKKNFYISQLNPLINKYSDIENQLIEREILPNDYLDEELKRVNYIFKCLKSYFSENERQFTNDDIYIFLSFLRDKNKEILESLKNIDEEYEV